METVRSKTKNQIVCYSKSVVVLNCYCCYNRSTLFTALIYLASHIVHCIIAEDPGTHYVDIYICVRVCVTISSSKNQRWRLSLSLAKYPNPRINLFELTTRLASCPFLRMLCTCITDSHCVD